MPRTLYHKLAAVLLVLFLLVGALFVWFSFFSSRMHLQEVNQKFNRTLAEQLASKNILFKNGRANAGALKDIFNTLMVINPAIEIYLLDPEGRILAYSAPPGKVKGKTVSLEPIRRFLGDAPAFPILGDDPRNPGEKKIFSAAPVVVPETEGPGRKPGGYLYIILGGEEYDSVAGMLRGSYILKQSFSIAGVGLLFALLAGLILFNLLTRRLRDLTRKMETFHRQETPGEANLADGSVRAAGDELDQLNESFNRLSERIQSQMKRLKETDTLRRELVANVSHDLRTPLASLRGYLETLLLKEGALTAVEKKTYLEVALRHSERLGKLISELFELATLDSRETAPKIEPFSLGELVQDVAQKFQLAAEKKGVRLRTDFKVDLPFVSADIGLIERVFENLIENALRFTPGAGTVTIAAGRDNGEVTASVSDTGEGVPEKDLPFIFDRFYRGDKTGAGGSGLGLAVAKRILELHGSTLTVESRPREGTTFTFQLPIARH